MNKLKKNIIYQYMLVSVVLVMANIYLFWGSTLINKWFLRNTLLSDIMDSVVFVIVEIMLFSISSYWYYGRVSKYIEAETSDQLKEQSQLFANIAHDLKSPMTAIVGLSRALEEGVTTKAERNEITHIIIEKSKHIDKIINLMLQYAKMESPSYQLNKNEVDIVRIIKEFVAQRYNEFERKDIELDLKLPNHKIMVWVDELEISRVIDNLITNALIHNAHGIRIQIGLEQFDENIKIWVADSGDEIEKEIENNIFSPFVCGEKSRNTKGGSGLGLAISKKFVEMHNGQIFIEKNIIGYKKSFVVIIRKNYF